MQERRRYVRQTLDFEDFPLYAEFMSSIFDMRMTGHIQNISSGGLCIMLLNSNGTKIKGDANGILHLSKSGKHTSIPAKIRWIDDTKNFIRYAGIEVPNCLLEKKLEEIF